MSLEELRKKIDAIDAEIVRLIGQRIGIAHEIGGEKRSQGRRVNDQAREKRVLGHIRSLARSEKVNQEVIEDIYWLTKNSAAPEIESSWVGLREVDHAVGQS